MRSRLRGNISTGHRLFPLPLHIAFESRSQPCIFPRVAREQRVQVNFRFTRILFMAAAAAADCIFFVLAARHAYFSIRRGLAERTAIFLSHFCAGMHNKDEGKKKGTREARPIVYNVGVNS